MAQVMKAQILDPEDVTCAGERGAHAIGIVWKDVLARPRLSLHDGPRFGRVLETPVIAVLGGGMLCIAH